MANSWFRMYAEFATDPKVQSMPEAMQRRLLMLFCLRCSDVLVTLRDDDIAFAMRITPTELAETKALFLSKNFIDERWSLIHWNDRQFVSDSSTERTRRYRERHRTSPERHSDALDTDTDTDTEPDTEQRKNSCAEGKQVPSAPDAPARRVAGTVPLNTGKMFPIYEDQIWEWSDAYPSVDVKQELKKFRVWCDANPTRRKTQKGILRAINTWLAREQDKGGKYDGKQDTAGKTDQRNQRNFEAAHDFIGRVAGDAPVAGGSAPSRDNGEHAFRLLPGVITVRS